MPPLPRDSWIGIIGTALGVIGLALSVYFYWVTREVRDLAFAEAGARTEIISAGRVSNAPLRVTRTDGTPLVGDVSALRFTLWNAGARVIRADQELESITVGLADSGAEVLDYRIARVTRPVVAPRVTRTNHDSARALRVGFRVLEPGDGITVEAIYRGSPRSELVVSGTYEGIPRIRRGQHPAPVLLARALWPVLGALGAGVALMAGIIGTSVVHELV